ncbi:universal stress protein [Actinophytocola sp.]|uniref:universal stress protein n=1 Tax=Actinophytocola sp. TaxID=1872138 RepID=UPI003D6C4F0B
MGYDESERYSPSIGQLPVVVGYNGRPPARKALVWAAAEANRRDAPLLVVYAANYPGMTLGPGPGLLDPSPRALEAAEEVTLRGVIEALAAQPELRVAGATKVTSPTQTLLQAAADAGLLVIGTRGHGRVLGPLLGSVAFAVAASASCPVVVVKTDASPRPTGPARGVVVGTDGSPGAAGSVRFAADHAAATSSPLQILTCTGERAPAGISPDRLRGAAQQIADTARRVVHRTHPQLSVTTVVEHGPAERALVEASAAAELVAVGTRGRGAFGGMLLGSVSHAVIHGARCPVAVIGADQPSQDTETDVRDAAAHHPRTAPDIVEIWGHGSFPASDPPANW